MTRLLAIILLSFSLAGSCYAQYQKVQFFFVDEFGASVDLTSSASIFVYQTGTTTQKPIRKDQRGGLTMAQPITPTSSNSGLITGAGQLTFYDRSPGLKLKVTDGNFTRTIDNLNWTDRVIVWPSYLTELGAITELVELSRTDGNFFVADGSNWTVESGATARTSMGVAIGTDVQAFDATLLSIAALGTASDKLLYTTGVDTWVETAITSYARTLLDDANATAFRTTLGVVIGTDVQAWDNDLDDIAALTPTLGNQITGDGTDWTSQAKAGFDNRDYANLAAAIFAIGASEGELHIWDFENLTESVVFPKTLSVIIHKGGNINKVSNYTVTFDGPFEAGIYQVFTGFLAGDVKMSGYVKTFYSQWWQENTVPGTTDFALAFDSTVKAMWKLPLATTSIGVGYDWTIPRGDYYSSTEIRITRALRMHGDGGGVATSFSNARIAFPVDVNGIVIVFESGAGTSGDPSSFALGTIIEGLRLTGVNSGTKGCGIIMTATATIENCSIFSFSKHGIYCQSEIQAGAEPNDIFDQVGTELIHDVGGNNDLGGVNGLVIKHCLLVQNMGDGIHIVGGNSNDPYLYGIQTQQSGGVGFHIQCTINGLFEGLLSTLDVAGSVRTWPNVANYIFVGCSLNAEGSGNESYVSTGTSFYGGDPGATLHASSSPAKWIGQGSGGDVSSPWRFTSRGESPGSETIDFRVSDYTYAGYAWWTETSGDAVNSAIGLRPVTASKYSEYRIGENVNYNPIQFYWASHATTPGQVGFPLDFLSSDNTSGRMLVANGTKMVPVASTGTGAPVLATTPTLTTPVLGDATGTSLTVTGYFSGAEISTPGPTADKWKIYAKTDNQLYFQDGAGDEKVIADSPSYSSIWYHGAESTTTISTQNIFTQVTDFVNVGEEDASGNLVGDPTTDDDIVVGAQAAGPYRLCVESSFRNAGGGATNMLIAAGITLATPIAITSSTDATPVVVTTTSAHGLKSGDMVRISGHATNTAANTDSIITVTGASTFSMANLSNASIVGSGGGAGTGGNVDVVFPGNVVVHRIVNQTTLGRGMAMGTYALAASDILEFYVADLGGTADFVSVQNVFCVERID